MGYNLSRIPTIHNALHDVRSKFNVARWGETSICRLSGKKVIFLSMSL